ncbi:MAG: hypothetical protein HYV01_01740 [Deltaproteobacteria bacterium]|nr:hypothetical protein [Deltaproteobacteria bacterium]
MSVIEKKAELEAYFHDAGKPRERWRVGTEYEKVGIDRSTAKAIPYFGRRGVEFILRELIERFGWEPQEQEGHIIALARGNAMITLEPGGQIELSGEPCESIHCTHAEFTQHIRELLEVAEPLDIVFLGLGMQPVSRLEEIEWVPKKRYRIMGPYMPKVGSLGQRMMKERGHNGERATLEDWNDHLTTLFPETRIKRYIEVRSVDSQPPELMLALPALVKGAFYDADCLQAAWDLVKDWSWDERMQVYLDSHRDALSARVRRYSLFDLAKELFQIAWEGLRRQNALNKQGEDETIYLSPLKNLLFQGKCPADVLVEKWEGELEHDIKKLISYSAYKLL